MPAIVTKYLETWNSTLWVGYSVHVRVKKLILYPWDFYFCRLYVVNCWMFKSPFNKLCGVRKKTKMRHVLFCHNLHLGKHDILISAPLWSFSLNLECGSCLLVTLLWEIRALPENVMNVHHYMCAIKPWEKLWPWVIIPCFLYMIWIWTFVVYDLSVEETPVVWKICGYSDQNYVLWFE